MQTRTVRAALAALAVLLSGAKPLLAEAEPAIARRGAVTLGIGLMGSGNYQTDMTAFLSSSFAGAQGGGSWLQVLLDVPVKVYGGLYVVPEVLLSYSSVEVSLSGFEATPNKRGVGLLQYGAGVRYYVWEPSFAAFFVQPSLRLVTGFSDVDGFPLDSDGLAAELKAGVELTTVRLPNLRIGLELGYARVPVKQPVDPAYVAQFHSPATALGGNYGGIFGSLTCSFWW